MNSFIARLKHDPHRRTLAILGAAAALFVLLAIVALWQRAAELAPKYEPTAMFPGLDANAVGSVRVQSRAGTFTVRFDRTHGWTIPEKAGFPADPSQVRAAAVGVAGLEPLEPKTANPDWHGQLGLVAPDKGGDATEITLMDKAGKPLAALLVGHGADVADAMGRGAIYVRKAGDNQTWLARGYLMAKPTLADWLDKRIVTVGRERIQSVDVAPPTGSAYMASRATKETPNFAVAPIPAGREIAFESAADAPVRCAGRVRVRRRTARASNFDFAQDAVTHTTKTFDGLVASVSYCEARTARIGRPLLRRRRRPRRAGRSDRDQRSRERLGVQIAGVEILAVRIDAGQHAKPPPGIPPQTTSPGMPVPPPQ